VKGSGRGLIWNTTRPSLVGLKKPWKRLNSRSLGREWNPGRFKHETGLAPTRLRRSVSHTLLSSWRQGNNAAPRRGVGGMRGNQECLKYPKWLAVLMAAFLFLFRASCGRRCSSPGINLIPSVDQRWRSVRFVVTLSCLITPCETCKIFGFYLWYSTNLRRFCVSTFYCALIFRSTYGNVIWYTWR
jgi:hypothetical protein